MDEMKVYWKKLFWRPQKLENHSTTSFQNAGDFCHVSPTYEPSVFLILFPLPNILH